MGTKNCNHCWRHYWYMVRQQLPRAYKLIWGLGVGSTFSGTAGAWAAADYNSATGATSVIGTSGATFYITGVQLEAGSTASPFAHENYGGYFAEMPAVL
jgi:hypothetical protein